ncbi:MAG TPA: S1C family serine protease [Candidatus Limnocylindrales bacterium]|nr:S1C family serine protease [Candidatus Limnocylindrales bacterium]
MDAHVRLLQQVAASTVTVAAEIPQSHPSAAVLGTSRAGTGAVVDIDGTIVTVNYVVLGANRVAVTDVDGKRLAARVIAQDFASGLAVLGVSGAALAPVRRGSSLDVSPGQDVFLVSSVGATERRSASGFVVSDDPFDAYWEYFLPRALWLSAINPGLGGAPLCDSRGRFVGVISLNLGAIGRATLAIPSENYYDHAEELLRDGKRTTRPTRAWVGMFCYALPDRTVVAGLIPGAPGERSGLAVGDILVRIDEEPITGRLQLYEAIWRRKPGDVIDLKVLREGHIESVVVTSGDAEEFFSV